MIRRGSWPGRQMESIDVVGSVLFNHRDDALAHAGENGRDDDRGHYADDDTEYGEKAAELVRAHVVERHDERFASEQFGKSEFHSD